MDNARQSLDTNTEIPCSYNIFRVKDKTMQVQSPHQFKTGFSNGSQGLFDAMNAAEEACEQRGADLKTTNMVRLCIEELVTNALKYGSKQDKPVSISINLAFGDDHIQLIIEDDSHPFNPLTEAPAPNLTEKLEDRTVGGLGIYLLKNMTKTMDYQYRDQKNVLTITI